MRSCRHEVVAYEENRVNRSVDWDDPDCVLVPAEGDAPAYTVADVIAEANSFSEAKLWVVAWKGGTHLARYLRAKRPNILTENEWRESAEYERRYIEELHGAPPTGGNTHWGR